MRYKEVLIVVKQGNVSASALGEKIACWLAAADATCKLVQAGSELDFERKPDLALVLGGDGTILGVARKLAGSMTPIIGINFGRVGFLTTFDNHVWQQGLELALAGALHERSCLALKWQVLRDSVAIAAGVAVNDVVVARGSLARLTSLEIQINDQRMGILRSDGAIITSPLGSSGYSVSAGGPVLHPDLDVVGLTPVCAFMSNVSSLVLPGDTTFRIAVLDISGDCYLTIDGQEGLGLAKRDVITVSGWPGAVRFLGEEANFFARLKTRAFALINDQSLDSQDTACQSTKQ